MAIKAPNYRVLVALQAIRPEGVEMAHLELHAQSENEAWSVAEMFINLGVTILSVTKLEGENYGVRGPA